MMATLIENPYPRRTCITSLKDICFYILKRLVCDPLLIAAMPTQPPTPPESSVFTLQPPELPAGVPLAHVFGKPVLEAPADLFIPPDALQVILESFEGPLDLLLYLIRKQNIDVLDIPVAQICSQYIAYIDTLSQRMELAADYLLMAALLIDIKSRLLLPRQEVLEEETEDPRAELARRLLDYEQMKLAALGLDALPQIGRDFLWLHVLLEQHLEPRLPEVTTADLRAAWLTLLTRAKRQRHHEVQQDTLSVREQMSWLLRKLEESGSLAFDDLLEPGCGVPYLVVNFIAMLELVKEGLLTLVQEAAYRPIYLRRP